MIEDDTIKLLRESDAGIKMGLSSIDDVIDYVNDQKFKKCLQKSKIEHEKLKDEMQKLLEKYQDEGKCPNLFLTMMATFKTNLEIMVHKSDAKIASLMTDGANMGVKSLNRYLNQYQKANDIAKDLTKRLINLEEKLVLDIRKYL